MSYDKLQDDFLTDMATSTDAAEPEGDKPEGDEARGEDAEKGEPAKPGTVATPAADSDKKDSGHVPLAALKAEREKRQELERQLAELRTNRQPDGRKPDPADPDKQEPDFYDDPKAFVAREISRAQREANGRLFAALEADAREQHADFDEVMEDMVNRVKENPALQKQVFSSPNPARAAYRLCKQLRDAEALQKDPDSVREAIRAEERARLEKEFAEKAKKQQAADDIPPDLASTRGTTSRLGFCNNRR